MKTLTRYIPSGFTEYKPEIGDYPKDLFAVYVDPVKIAAIFYSKKQSTHTFFNRFRTVDDMKKKINDTISNLMAWEDVKSERRAARKTGHTLKVGDILDSSWGYDQTNVNFYQVIEIVGAHTVKIREIASTVISSDGGPTTHVVATKDAFLTPASEYDDRGRILTRRASADNTLYASECQFASLWNGKPKYETASGWGH